MLTRGWIYQGFQSSMVSSTVLWGCSSLKGQWLVLHTSTCFKNPLFLLCQLYGDEDIQYQQDGASPHYHCNAGVYLDNTFTKWWTGHTICWVPPSLPQLTYLTLTPDFSCGVTWRMQCTAQSQQHFKMSKEIEWSCTAIPATTLVAAFQLLTAVNCATKLTVVILNTHTRSANSLTKCQCWSR
jgi:hypothetical protein